MEVRETIDIDAPVERVWEIMQDVERWHEWTESITSIRREGFGPLAVGTKATVRQPRLPTAQWTVTSLEPGRSFVWKNDAPGMHSVGTHSVRPREGGGSTAELSLAQTGPFGVVMGRLMRGLTKRYVHMEAEGLKKRAESA